MLANSRVGTTMDTGRAGNALARPGVDTRVWTSLALVTGPAMVDAEGGVFCPISLLPLGDLHTAQLSSPYAGPGYGFYFPLNVDDYVLVTAPNGNPDEGLTIIGRPWSGGEPPPQDAVDNPADVLLVVQQDSNVRIRVQGAGNVVMNPSGTGQVILGADLGDAALQAAALGATIQMFLDGNPQLAGMPGFLGLVSSFNQFIEAYVNHTHGPGNTAAVTAVPNDALTVAIKGILTTYELDDPTVTAEKVQVK